VKKRRTQECFQRRRSCCKVGHTLSTCRVCRSSNSISAQSTTCSAVFINPPTGATPHVFTPLKRVLQTSDRTRWTMDQRNARSVNTNETIWKKRGHTFSRLHGNSKPLSQNSSSRRRHIINGPSYSMKRKFLVISPSALLGKFITVYFDVQNLSLS
jgi:hypothetical protein